MDREVFDDKFAPELVRVTFDFTSDLTESETIVSRQVNAYVYSGVDASPEDLISGPATSPNRAQVYQYVTGGIAGVVYLLRATVTTSLSQILQREGFLAVLPLLGTGPTPDPPDPPPPPDFFDATFLTEDDETTTFPNSRQLLAGQGVSFDDSVPGERTINVGTEALVTGSFANIDVYELIGSPGGAQTLTFTLSRGSRVYSNSPTQPALDFSSFPGGSAITFVNQGKVMGRGGRGGPGGYTWRIGSSDAGFKGTNGQAGGTAIKGPGAASSLVIDNGAGFIWGGGGGGGGGGVSSDDGSNLANGGGGGGGAGGGPGAPGGQLADVEGTAITPAGIGVDGTYASSGAGGAASNGTNTGTATGGNGGAGGDWGTAGSAGASPTGQARDIAGGTAGAAGLAVDQNGGTVTFSSGNSAPRVKGAIT